jgi:hypothetical protein
MGTAPNRQFVVEWRNVSFWADPSVRTTFEVVFSENGQITYRYGTVTATQQRGDHASIGLENSAGTTGFTFSYRLPVLVSGRATTFTPVP